MDAGNLIYIIAVIIYFIYSALKKNKGQDEIDLPETPQEQSKPVSFEDLLKEIRQGQQAREKDLSKSGQGKAVEDRKPVPAHYDDPNPRRYQAEVKKQPKAFEKFQGEVSERERPKLLTLDEQVRLTGSIEGIKSSLYTESLEKEEGENKYAKLLKNPETVKDAVILGEILNRKHF